MRIYGRFSGFLGLFKRNFHEDHNVWFLRNNGGQPTWREDVKRHGNQQEAHGRSLVTSPLLERHRETFPQILDGRSIERRCSAASRAILQSAFVLLLQTAACIGHEEAQVDESDGGQPQWRAPNGYISSISVDVDAAEHGHWQRHGDESIQQRYPRCSRLRCTHICYVTGPNKKTNNGQCSKRILKRR